MTNENYTEILIEKIITEAGLEALPEESKEEFKKNLELQINRRIGLISLDCLNEEGLDLYEKYMSENEVPDGEKLKEIFDKHAPGYEEKIREGLDSFMSEIMTTISKK